MRRLALWAVLAALGAAGFWAGSLPPAPILPVRYHCGSAAAAWDKAQGVLLTRIKTPASAVFSDRPKIAADGPGKWRIAAWFDAQNAFGVLIRTAFEMGMECDDAAGWRVLDVRAID